MITSSYQKREEACLPDLAVLQSEEAIQEYQEPHQSSREQHPRVPAEPGEVQADRSEASGASRSAVFRPRYRNDV